MANKNLVKEVRLKVVVSELFQKAFTTMIHFRKRLSIENLISDLGGIFNVLDVTALAFAQIINVRQTGSWETDWIVISSEEATGLAGSLYFCSALNTFTRDEVVTRFRLPQDQYPD